MYIGRIMRTELITVSPETTLVEAKELLEQSADDEFLEFKAFLCLKEKGKSVRLSSFLDSLAKASA